MDQRLQTLSNWLTEQLQIVTQITPIVGDASFRRYFRVQNGHESFIAMDSPPELENPAPFIAVGKAFSQLGLKVPEIHAADVEKGFLLLSDLGEQLYLPALNSKTADTLYRLALKDLDIIQHCQKIPNWPIPAFDAKFMQTEMSNCQQWFLEQHLDMTINHATQQLLDSVFKQLVASATEQPQCCVHRDYHSRNLLILPDNRVGILDFQDAVWGPITYDAVSLLRDCYIDWPKEQVTQWALSFHEQRRATGALSNCSAEQFLRWFDFMGMQRHLKCLFIFARKYHRDGTTAYLTDLPRTLNYIVSVSAAYPELSTFHQWLTDTVVPTFNAVKEST